jgi:flagellar hook-associated protein 3 FlgL
MAIRVTQNQIAAQFNTDVQSIYTKIARTQQQLSDGRQITRPSDDPFGTGQVLGFDTQLADVRRYKANVAESMAFMNAADSALDTVTSALHAIYEKALQASNGTNSLADLQSIAAEIEQLKEVLRDGLNVQHGDSFIFGGTATGAPPFPAGANTFDGTLNTMSRRVGQGQSVQINVPGSAIVGPNGANTLDEIDALLADLQAQDYAAIQGRIGALQAATDQALGVRTQLGATTARLEVMQARLDLTEERLLSARSDIADVDMAEAYMRFMQQQTMYEAALAAGTRIMQTSILNFI